MPGSTLSKSVGREEVALAVGVEVGVAAVDDERRAVRDPGVEVGRHLVAVLAGDERAHVAAAGAVAGDAACPSGRLIFETSSSAIGSTATSAEIAMQRSPAEPKPALTAASAARSRSASGRTSMWFFAPPRAWTRLPCAVPVS